MSDSPLPRSFYAEGALEVAPKLLGTVLHRRHGDRVLSGIITEVEAYRGEADDASHAYRGPTPRTQTMFGPPGHAYVYLIYGMWNCMNIVCREDGGAEAVLIRGLEPLTGIDLMRENRHHRRALADGPGKLCQALGITRADNGADLLGPQLWLTEGCSGLAHRTTPRVGIDYAELTRHEPWRFVAQSEAVTEARATLLAQVGPGAAAEQK